MIQPSRAVLITAPPGFGKSTLAAAVFQVLLSQRAPGKRNIPTGPIGAAHFVRFGDAQRCSPLQIVKSLAYQVAMRWVWVWGGVGVSGFVKGGETERCGRISRAWRARWRCGGCGRQGMVWGEVCFVWGGAERCGRSREPGMPGGGE
eukprot:364226-Chlamydomonas_euryale.AAC.4